jgi:3-(3-hydroxy-phenyl)propionate hydroxylase
LNMVDDTSSVDAVPFAGAMVPGAPAADAPVAIDGEPAWLLHQLGGAFCVMLFDGPPADGWAARVDAQLSAMRALPFNVRPILVVPKGVRVDRSRAEFEHVCVIEDIDGLAAERFDARAGTVYLVRPDQHVCARWRDFDATRIAQSLRRAMGWDLGASAARNIDPSSDGYANPSAGDRAPTVGHGSVSDCAPAVPGTCRKEVA